jgi:GNAT superfamily N-acetyltransferase
VATIVIEPARSADDLEQVRGLMRAYGTHLATNPAGAVNICLAGYERELAELPGYYAPPPGELLLARVESAAAGCIGFRPVPAHRGADQRERACEMKRLWVGDAFRGLGLGRKLAEAGIAWARAAGYDAIYLDTVPAAMPEANALYLRLGFERTERYNDNPVDDLAFYRLRLG